MRYRTEALVLLALDGLLFVVLGIRPKADRFTWFLENAPVIFGVAALAIAWPRFKFTRLTNRLMALHAVVLIVGGYYTYAEVPIGFWVQHALDLSRNHYDRLGHLFQGFVPAMIVREFLLRRSPLKAGKLVFFLSTCVCLAISAFYELIEWWTAIAQGASADAFLGSQGDPWDAQADMLMCLIGAMAAQASLSWLHDRQLARHEQDVAAAVAAPSVG